MTADIWLILGWCTYFDFDVYINSIQCNKLIPWQFDIYLWMLLFSCFLGYHTFCQESCLGSWNPLTGYRSMEADKFFFFLQLLNIWLTNAVWPLSIINTEKIAIQCAEICNINTCLNFGFSFLARVCRLFFISSITLRNDGYRFLIYHNSRQ